jgi:molybdopterin-guanine dinucleotide biosynthesis protein A
MKKFGTAIILAGGKSSRMGFDKQFLKTDNRRLMNSLISKLKNEFDEIIIVTNKPKDYIGFKVKVTTDKIKNVGPLAGIHVGLIEASSKYSFVVACDMPNINIKYITYMREKITNEIGCITEYDNHIEPFSSFYSKEIISDIEKHLQTKMRSINSLAKKLNILYIKEKEARKFSPNWDMFLNINTKEDLNLYLENEKWSV